MKKNADTMRPAKVGDQFKQTHASDGEKLEDPGPLFSVVESCKGNGGAWVCCKHGMAFRHNFDKDSHISSKRGCVLAWFCMKHGRPEAP